MIAIVDTGLEEIRLITPACSREGEALVVSEDQEVLLDADQLILYSSSSFPESMFALQQKGLDRIIKERVRSGKKLFAIGVGMQLLFTGSNEEGYHKGLNLLPGHVVPFPEEERFEGESWVSFIYPHPLIRHLKEGHGYFSHAFYVRPHNQDDVLARNEKGVPAVVGRGNVLGVQFYPDKSGIWGQQWISGRELCITH